ncbi:hypothetical protein D3C81_1761510 [compost metagenome]
MKIPFFEGFQRPNQPLDPSREILGHHQADQEQHGQNDQTDSDCDIADLLGILLQRRVRYPGYNTRRHMGNRLLDLHISAGLFDRA